ncbi:MAG: DUF4126 domain-containing protein, partial [Proteobacteria bacterium]|nr:DUF4126 domain-containing protein [Pseudomonadota bacterium]
MDAYQQLITTVALTMGTAWAAGINLYATIAVLGFLGLSGNIVLPEQLLVLQDPMVVGAAAFMYMIEFFVDKTPGVDTAWDTVHSFIRIPAGVLLAAGAVGEVNPSMVIVAGVLGGGVAATTHTIKAGTRVLINTSPEPFTNWTASVLEDITVVAGLWAALHYPLAFLIFFVAFLLAAVWILPKIWTGIKTVFHGLLAFFSRKTPPPPTPGDHKTGPKELP